VKILLATRGSQGDVYPYLALAKGLKENGHEITISLPYAFEKFAKELDVSYLLQAGDVETMAGKIRLKNLLSWLGEMINSQFRELLPLVEAHDISIVTNTEFAIPTIAEYAGKPFVRTAYSHYIPGKKLYPPISPLVHYHTIFPPILMWKALNFATNKIAIGPVNQWRKDYGLHTLKDHNDYAYSRANNLLLYSPLVGEVDHDWKYPWSISGCCFNDCLPYDKALLEKFIAFTEKDSRPIIFFTAGSIKGAVQTRFVRRLFAVCQKHHYRLVIGSGWAKLGETMAPANGDDLFILDSVIPHNFVFERCTALMHHGGSGTTHNAVRSGKPQMVVPLMTDQFYWGERTRVLGLGPGTVNLKQVNSKKLEVKILDLMTNTHYAKNAVALGERLRAEDGVKNTVKYIEGLI
jgi:UDP:flavonoid glycosyltransferase YjiC (YdhE family)